MCVSCVRVRERAGELEYSCVRACATLILCKFQLEKIHSSRKYYPRKLRFSFATRLVFFHLCHLCECVLRSRFLFNFLSECICFHPVFHVVRCDKHTNYKKNWKKCVWQSREKSGMEKNENFYNNYKITTNNHLTLPKKIEFGTFVCYCCCCCFPMHDIFFNPLWPFACNRERIW